MTIETRLQNASRYKRISISLSNKAAQILAEIAEAEKRTVQQQASYMLEKELCSLSLSAAEERVPFWPKVGGKSG